MTVQRKAYVPGVAVLLTALLAGCTAGDDSGGSTGDAKQGDAGAAVPAAEPGRYRTLPEPCGALSRSTLDSLLPGIKENPDEEQRNKAYEGTATATYDTDRRVGCRWKAESAAATHHLLVDLDRIVSYDSDVSDDQRAEEVYADKEKAAELPPSGTPSAGASDAPDPSSSTGPATASGKSPAGETSPKPDGSPGSGAPGGSGEPDDAGDASASGSTDGPGDTDSTGSTGSTGSADNSGEPDDAATEDDLTALLPRVLDDLGDAAFVDDALGSPGSTQRRTVTVVFRTSNVVVTIEYEAQPTVPGEPPSSREMQDRARNLAARLAERLSN
ncbi:DUF3558 domain-containing protein [Streptomyces uncialis]|uniref:DUF3558 domain-containing protein n=1 Tax=Streptomyces uncialis TaxID=1048205 RepID=UPI00386FD9C6